MYGLKVSGKEGATAVGLLHLIDKSPAASVHELDTPGFGEADVENRVALNLARSHRRSQRGFDWRYGDRQAHFR